MRKTVVLIAYLLAVLVVVTACQTPAGRSAGQVVDDGTITTGRPLTAGNKVTLLVDGPATHGALFKAIEGAKDHINFETFVFADNGKCSNRPWFYYDLHRAVSMSFPGIYSCRIFACHYEV